MNNAENAAKNALLCPTNDEVNYINDISIEKMYGNAYEITSFNTPLEPRDEHHNFRAGFNIETIQNEKPSGMPPHILKLKVNSYRFRL